MSKHASPTQAPMTAAKAKTSPSPYTPTHPQVGAARPERDPLSPFGHEMLTLFRGPLADVRFPDLDRAVLEASADEAIRAQLEVEAMERALEDARAAARDASVSFADRASRALAYVRIFATGQPALEQQLAASPLLGTASPAHASLEPKSDGEKKKRGRPRKDSSTAALLPMRPEPAPEAVAVQQGAVEHGDDAGAPDDAIAAA